MCVCVECALFLLEVVFPYEFFLRLYRITIIRPAYDIYTQGVSEFPVQALRTMSCRAVIIESGIENIYIFLYIVNTKYSKKVKIGISFK